MHVACIASVYNFYSVKEKFAFNRIRQSAIDITPVWPGSSFAAARAAAREFGAEASTSPVTNKEYRHSRTRTGNRGASRAWRQAAKARCGRSLSAGSPPCDPAGRLLFAGSARRSAAAGDFRTPGWRGCSAASDESARPQSPLGARLRVWTVGSGGPPCGTASILPRAGRRPAADT